MSPEHQTLVQELLRRLRTKRWDWRWTDTRWVYSKGCGINTCVSVITDGKLYDAYISYVNNDYDRKFVNFILKPHLENKNGYKVHLNDNDILPGAGKTWSLWCVLWSRIICHLIEICLLQQCVSPEPSAELVMNISRSRRLIVLLSHAYLEQDWCSNNFRSDLTLQNGFKILVASLLLTTWGQCCNVLTVCVRRQGLLHLLELCPRPIVITLEGQYKRMSSEIKQQLSDHQHCLTVLTWRHNSVVRSTVNHM